MTAQKAQSEIENLPLSQQALTDICSKQRAEFNKNPNSDWPERKKKIMTLGRLIADNEEKFVEAISQDFGNRSIHETLIAEMIVIQNAIKHALKHTKHWMRIRPVKTALHFMPASNCIAPQPLGVVGVISPWNYPLQLAIMPIIGALGAGNRVMVKPSELTPVFSELLKQVLAKGFSDDEIFVATGGAEIGQAFSTVAFDHLLFTGSTNVGRHVAAAAARNLTPITLELGGKSPTIIDKGADMAVATSRITNGKLLNAGQTCVAPDYVLMPQSRIEEFTQAMIKQAERFYPTVAGNADYTSIISESHYQRLQGILKDAEEKGAQLITAGSDDAEQLAKERRMPLTIVLNTTPDMRISKEEIFGPLLPVMASESLDEALEYVQQNERPLALYWFGSDKAKKKKVIAQSISGGVAINDTAWQVVQEDIPFGGVGPSGMGAYHGEHGFETFSHMKGVFVQSKFSSGKILLPPYTNKTDSIIKLLKKII